MNNNFKDLRDKILGILYEEAFESDSEYISFYDLLDICKSQIGYYNELFKNSIIPSRKVINLKSKFNSIFYGPSLLINDITLSVKDNEPLINILLSDTKGKYAGEMELLEKNNRMINFDENRYTKRNDVLFINDCIYSYEILLNKLDEFIENNPGVDYSWVFEKKLKKDERKIVVNDGFLSGTIYFDNLDKSFVSFQNINDITFATMKTKEYGTLYDYIEFYQDNFKKRLAVKIDDLDPFVKKLVRNYMFKNNEKELKLK